MVKGKRCEETDSFHCLQVAEGNLPAHYHRQMPFVHRQAGATDLRQLWLKSIAVSKSMLIISMTPALLLPLQASIESKPDCL